jgi:hypothetical protein
VTWAQPFELRSIQGVDISDYISDIFRSRDRILEIKMTTTMFEVARIPERYHDEKEDKKTNFNVLVNRTEFRIDNMNQQCPDIDRHRKRQMAAASQEVVVSRVLYQIASESTSEHS